MQYQSKLVFSRPNIQTPFADPNHAYENQELNFDSLIEVGLLESHSLDLSVDGLVMTVTLDWVSEEKFREYQAALIDDNNTSDWKKHWKSRVDRNTGVEDNWFRQNGVRVYTIIDGEEEDVA
jgi:hypothetical protein